jgi:hypothetical protein
MTHQKARRLVHDFREIKKREHRHHMYRQIGGVLQPESLNQGGSARIYIPASSPEPYPDGPDPTLWKGEWATVSHPEGIA